MRTNRLLLFLAALIAVFFTLQTCWQNKSLSEKWLYVHEDAARNYAGDVLGVGRGTDVPVPESLAGASIRVYDTYVTFAPKKGPPLTLAFSPEAKPPAPQDPARAGEDWIPLRDGWYRLALVSDVTKGDNGTRR